MRLPRLRFTVRQAMIAVTLVAVLLAVVMRRRDYCLTMAARHTQQEETARAAGRVARSKLVALRAWVVAGRHAELRWKYQQVASRPWKPLPDDPYLDKTQDGSPLGLNSP